MSRSSCRNRLASFGGADVRRRHDLDERRPAAVVVDERIVGTADPARVAADVHCLRRVLLQMGPLDPDDELAVRHGDYHTTANARGQIVLGNLIALWQVGIEVVLACEYRVRCDLAPECQSELDRPLHGGTIRHGERARKAETHGGRLVFSPAPNRPHSGRTSSSSSSAGTWISSPTTVSQVMSRSLAGHGVEAERLFEGMAGAKQRVLAELAADQLQPTGSPSTGRTECSGRGARRDTTGS